MQGEEARRFPLIREHPEHTPHANEDGAGHDGSGKNRERGVMSTVMSGTYHEQA